MGLSSSHNHSFSRPHLSTWCAGGQTSSLKANFQNWVCASCGLVCQCELGGTYPSDHLEAYICSNTCLISIHEQCIPAPPERAHRTTKLLHIQEMEGMQNRPCSQVFLHSITDKPVVLFNHHTKSSSDSQLPDILSRPFSSSRGFSSYWQTV